MLLLDRIWHDDQEEVEVLGLLGLCELPAVGVLTTDVLQIVVINGLLEGLDAGLVAELNDVAVVNIDVESALFREFIEAVIEVLSVLNVLLQAEDGPFLEMDRLMYDGTQNLCIVKRPGQLLSALSSLVMAAWLVDLWALEHSGLDGVWLKIDVQLPLFDFLRIGNHSVELLDAPDSLRWLLKEGLPDLGHDPLILSDLCWDTDQCAKLWRQVDILPLLPDLEQRLIDGVDFHAISGLEVVNHVGSSLLVAMVKDVVLGVHVPLDLVHLVGSVRTVLGHDDGPFEFSVYEILVVSLSSIID